MNPEYLFKMIWKIVPCSTGAKILQDEQELFASKHEDVYGHLKHFEELQKKREKAMYVEVDLQKKDNTSPKDFKKSEAKHYISHVKERVQVLKDACIPKPREKTIPSEDIEKKTEHEQPKQPKIILEETCIVKSKDYVFYDLDLDAKETVKGEITSDETINIYFLTKYGFRSFENDEQFSYEYGAESVLKKKIDFKPSKTATWYLVIENERKNKATVNVNLFV